MMGQRIFTERPVRPSGRAVGLWIAAALLVALGSTAAGAQTEVDDPALLEQGEAVFSTSCVGCHGADGTGSNTGRPLVGIADQEPDRSVHIQSVTEGKGGMPSFGANLSEDEINAAVTYVRLTFVADRSVDELPNTGLASSLFVMAAGLIGAGVALTEAARRRQRFPV